jgi:hypothetical protein
MHIITVQPNPDRKATQLAKIIEVEAAVKAK